jgi:hypothetical protein
LTVKTAVPVRKAIAEKPVKQVRRVRRVHKGQPVKKVRKAIRVKKASKAIAVHEDLLSAVEAAAFLITGSSTVFSTDDHPQYLTEARADALYEPLGMGPGGGGLGSLVDDTSPQLGGNLDLNNFEISGSLETNVLVIDGGLLG